MISSVLIIRGFIFSAIYVIIVCQDRPEITERILPEIKQMGTTGRLNCTIINKADNPVEWLQVNTGYTLTQDETVVIEDKYNEILNGYPKYQIFSRRIGQKITYMLVMNHLEPKDSGEYRCQVWIRNSVESDRIVQKEGYMIVVFPPQILQMSTSSTMMVKAGEAVDLKCDATGYPYPNITWVRVNGSPLPSGKLRVMNKTLNFQNVRTEDRGVYRCLADNNVRPPALFDMTLLVAFTPVAYAIQDSYGQAENRMFDVILECRVAGYPEPELRWHKLTKSNTWEEIKNDDKHSLNILLNHANILGPNERWFQIVIRTVTANDYGTYICEGMNNYGSGHAKIKLFATSECQGQLCVEEQRPGGRDSAAVLTIRFSLIFICSFISFF